MMGDYAVSMRTKIIRTEHHVYLRDGMRSCRIKEAMTNVPDQAPLKSIEEIEGGTRLTFVEECEETP